MRQRSDPLSEAFRILGRSDQLSINLRERLLRLGFTEPEADQALARLEELGLLNDAKVSERWARRSSESPANGRLRIIADLVRKGVDESDAEHLAEVYLADGDELDRAKQLALTLSQAGKNAVQAARYLGSRGFRPETVEQAIEGVYDQ
ncbi:MAG: RecX family transcriptional regulator [Fimbriimonadaceae bacterium]|nr:RecX family transcriptional regulator [Fimbriimonadaceae bacterium]